MLSNFAPLAKPKAFRPRHRLLAASPLILLPIAARLITPNNWPAWAHMWLLSFAIYAGCKLLTWLSTPINAPAWRHIAYLFFWPGMNAKQFLTGTPTQPILPSEWLRASIAFATGTAMVWLLARHTPHPYLAGWVGMVGIVLILHFGLFGLMSCAWRTAGIDAKPLMEQPLHATSPIDFWSRRWNTAFRDLTHAHLFRPLATQTNVPAAFIFAFLISGLIHDLVISIPAHDGYGGPTIFFLIQALGILATRTAIGRSLGIGAGRSGWLFTHGLMLATAPLLFHQPFAEQVITPFLQAIGAL